MVKYLFWIGLGLFAIWLLKATGIIMAATLFVIAGVIPGTQFSVPPVVMFVLLAIMLLLVFYWVKRQQLARQIKDLKTKHYAETTSSTNRQEARYSRPKAATR